MVDTIIKFLTFDEAIAAAKKEADVEFVGLQYVPPYSHLDVYMVIGDPDEVSYVNISYEGGDLFDVGGEEDFYGLDDVPDEAKSLFYVRLTDLGDGKAQISGMVSEYILNALLPALSEANTYSSETAFVEAARTQFLAFWRQS
jgi:hypothetical protein